MNDHLDIGLPDKVTPDWKFKHLKSFGTIQSTKSDYVIERHTNIFRTIDMILDVKDYSDGYDVGLPEEEEGPLSPLRVKKSSVESPDAKLYKLREEIRERLNKSGTKKNKEAIVTLNDEASIIVKPILKAELESGYFTSGFLGTQSGDGNPSRITFELNSALKRKYIWRGYANRNGSVTLDVLKEENNKPSKEFRELVSNVFR